MLLSTEVFGFSVACLATLFLTPLVRRIAMQIGWRDRPDAQHKQHRAARPSAGGIAIVLGLLTAIGVLRLAFESASGYFDPLLAAVAPGALLVAAIGLLDDFRGIRPIEKLVTQAVAISIFQSSAYFLGLFEFMDVSTPMMVMVAIGVSGWLLGLTNAMNLIDGIDGLACGISIVASLGLAVIASLMGEGAVAVLAACIAGAGLGVFRSNRFPARVFLGDSGSMLLGFLLASAAALLWTRQPSVHVAVAMGLLLWVPLVDTTLTVFRRLRSGVSLFRADRDHIHHRLLRDGLSSRSAARRLTALGSAAALAAVATVVSVPAWAATTVLVLITLPVFRAALPLRVTQPVTAGTGDGADHKGGAEPSRTREQAA